MAAPLEDLLSSLPEEEAGETPSEGVGEPLEGEEPQGVGDEA